MSVTLSIEGYKSTNSSEYKKHMEVVKFCMKKDVSYPIETIEFFGKIHEHDCGIDDLDKDTLMDSIKEGISVNLPYESKDFGVKYIINVCDIPKDCDKIIVKMD